mmetsp:Transcript_4581/g.5966  ORF Transcript_4581/g.5966 Transcript_4581/m.5966 type:complete len:213 (+) Transcript_4581:69-707(+)
MRRLFDLLIPGVSILLIMFTKNNLTMAYSNTASMTSNLNHILNKNCNNSNLRQPDKSMNRSMALKKMALIPFLMTQGASMAEAKVSIKPDAAFANLVKAREELMYASKTYIPKEDYDGLRTYFADAALNINNYEDNANVLLASKQLDAESKKEIGTIRRYGVGADVIIMYGGFKAEFDEENESPNYSSMTKMLKRTVDSLDEVIAICRSNGF